MDELYDLEADPTSSRISSPSQRRARHWQQMQAELQRVLDETK